MVLGTPPRRGLDAMRLAVGALAFARPCVGLIVKDGPQQSSGAVAHAEADGTNIFDDQCLPFSPTFTLAPKSRAPDYRGFARIVMADYPSTGSTWLRQLLQDAALSAGVAPPSCSIYGPKNGEEGETWWGYGVKHLQNCSGGHDVHCDCAFGWTPSEGAVLVKSHFPAQENSRRAPMYDWQYSATSDFDKILVILRHPVASAKSYHSRWLKTSPWNTLIADFLAENIRCWATWWARAAKTVPPSHVLYIRYEDLCTDTARTLYAIFQFMGGRYAGASLAAIEASLSPETRCKHAEELPNINRVQTAEDWHIVNKVRGFMKSWGYSLNAEDSRVPVSSLGDALADDEALQADRTDVQELFAGESAPLGAVW